MLADEEIEEDTYSEDSVEEEIPPLIQPSSARRNRPPTATRRADTVRDVSPRSAVTPRKEIEPEPIDEEEEAYDEDKFEDEELPQRTPAMTAPVADDGRAAATQQDDDEYSDDDGFEAEQLPQCSQPAATSQQEAPAIVVGHQPPSDQCSLTPGQLKTPASDDIKSHSRSSSLSEGYDDVETFDLFDTLGSFYAKHEKHAESISVIAASLLTSMSPTEMKSPEDAVPLQPTTVTRSSYQLPAAILSNAELTPFQKKQLDIKTRREAILNSFATKLEATYNVFCATVCRPSTEEVDPLPTNADRVFRELLPAIQDLVSSPLFNIDDVSLLLLLPPCISVSEGFVRPNNVFDLLEGAVRSRFVQMTAEDTAEGPFSSEECDAATAALRLALKNPDSLLKTMKQYDSNEQICTRVWRWVVELMDNSFLYACNKTMRFVIGMLEPFVHYAHQLRPVRALIAEKRCWARCAASVAQIPAVTQAIALMEAASVRVDPLETQAAYCSTLVHWFASARRKQLDSTANQGSSEPRRFLGRVAVSAATSSSLTPPPNETIVGIANSLVDGVLIPLIAVSATNSGACVDGAFTSWLEACIVGVAEAALPIALTAPASPEVSLRNARLFYLVHHFLARYSPFPLLSLHATKLVNLLVDVELQCEESDLVNVVTSEDWMNLLFIATESGPSPWWLSTASVQVICSALNGIMNYFRVDIANEASALCEGLLRFSEKALIQAPPPSVSAVDSEAFQSSMDVVAKDLMSTINASLQRGDRKVFNDSRSSLIQLFSRLYVRASSLLFSCSVAKAKGPPDSGQECMEPVRRKSFKDTIGQASGTLVAQASTMPGSPSEGQSKPPAVLQVYPLQVATTSLLTINMGATNLVKLFRRSEAFAEAEPDTPVIENSLFSDVCEEVLVQSLGIVRILLTPPAILQALLFREKTQATAGSRGSLAIEASGHDESLVDHALVNSVLLTTLLMSSPIDECRPMTFDTSVRHMVLLIQDVKRAVERPSAVVSDVMEASTRRRASMETSMSLLSSMATPSHSPLLSESLDRLIEAMISLATQCDDVLPSRSQGMITLIDALLQLVDVSLTVTPLASMPLCLALVRRVLQALVKSDSLRTDVDDDPSLSLLCDKICQSSLWVKFLSSLQADPQTLCSLLQALSEPMKSTNDGPFSSRFTLSLLQLDLPRQITNALHHPSMLPHHTSFAQDIQFCRDISQLFEALLEDGPVSFSLIRGAHQTVEKVRRGLFELWKEDPLVLHFFELGGATRLLSTLNKNKDDEIARNNAVQAYLASEAITAFPTKQDDRIERATALAEQVTLERIECMVDREAVYRMRLEVEEREGRVPLIETAALKHHSAREIVAGIIDVAPHPQCEPVSVQTTPLPVELTPQPLPQQPGALVAKLIDALQQSELISMCAAEESNRHLLVAEEQSARGHIDSAALKQRETIHVELMRRQAEDQELQSGREMLRLETIIAAQREDLMTREAQLKEVELASQLVDAAALVDPTPAEVMSGGATVGVEPPSSNHQEIGGEAPAHDGAPPHTAACLSVAAAAEFDAVMAGAEIALANSSKDIEHAACIPEEHATCIPEEHTASIPEEHVACIPEEIQHIPDAFDVSLREQGEGGSPVVAFGELNVRSKRIGSMWVDNSSFNYDDPEPGDTSTLLIELEEALSDLRITDVSREPPKVRSALEALRVARSRGISADLESKKSARGAVTNLRQVKAKAITVIRAIEQREEQLDKLHDFVARFERSPQFFSPGLTDSMLSAHLTDMRSASIRVVEATTAWRVDQREYYAKGGAVDGHNNNSIVELSNIPPAELPHTVSDLIGSSSMQHGSHVPAMAPTVFYWRGMNYNEKMKQDLHFLTTSALSPFLHIEVDKNVVLMAKKRIVEKTVSEDTCRGRNFFARLSAPKGTLPISRAAGHMDPDQSNVKEMQKALDDERNANTWFRGLTAEELNVAAPKSNENMNKPLPFNMFLVLVPHNWRANIIRPLTTPGSATNSAWTGNSPAERAAARVAGRPASATTPGRFSSDSGAHSPIEMFASLRKDQNGMYNSSSKGSALRKKLDEIHNKIPSSADHVNRLFRRNPLQRFASVAKGAVGHGRAAALGLRAASVASAPSIIVDQTPVNHSITSIAPSKSRKASRMSTLGASVRGSHGGSTPIASPLGGQPAAVPQLPPGWDGMFAVVLCIFFYRKVRIRAKERCSATHIQRWFRRCMAQDQLGRKIEFEFGSESEVLSWIVSLTRPEYKNPFVDELMSEEYGSIRDDDDDDGVDYLEHTSEGSRNSNNKGASRPLVISVSTPQQNVMTPASISASLPRITVADHPRGWRSLSTKVPLYANATQLRRYYELSASIIQKQWRSSKRRRLMLSLISHLISAMKIQKWFRRQMLASLFQRAATVIRMGQKIFFWWRKCRQDTIDRQRRRRHRSSIIVQRWFRICTARKILTTLRRENKAAICIQRAVRGHLGRERAAAARRVKTVILFIKSKLWYRRLAEVFLNSEATRRIKLGFLRCKARRLLEDLKLKQRQALKVFLRMDAAIVERRAITTIFAVYKGWKTRQCLLDGIHDSSYDGDLGRGRRTPLLEPSVTSSLQRSSLSSLAMNATWRVANFLVTDYLPIIVTIQCCFRRAIARRILLRLREEKRCRSVHLAAWLVGAKRLRVFRRECAVKAAAVFNSILQRSKERRAAERRRQEEVAAELSRYRNLQATIIQSTWRMFSTRQCFLDARREHALWKAKRDADELVLDNIIRLQLRTRLFLRMLKWQRVLQRRRHYAATRIQRAWRLLVARREALQRRVEQFKRETVAAFKIQTVFRAFVEGKRVVMSEKSTPPRSAGKSTRSSGGRRTSGH